jgi:hypothetical protein
MGRLSQVFWVLQAKKMPDKREAQFHYSHLDVDQHRKALKQLRRARRKNDKEAQ